MSGLDSFHRSCTLIVQFQQATNCSKSTVDTRKRCEICSKITIKTPKRRNWLIDIVLVSLFLLSFPTFSIFDFKQVITCWSVLAQHGYNVVTNPYLHWRNLKKLIENCFPKLIMWNTILQKIIWFWQKLSMFLNTRNYPFHNMSIKARVKNIIPSLF